MAPDSTLAPPTVVETDPFTKMVPSMLRIHIQDAQLPAGCNPYAVVSVGPNSAHSKQLLSSENPALASTGYAYFDEQFVVEYDPRHTKDCFVSVAFFERLTNAPIGEWRAPISNFDHSSRGFLGFGKRTPSTNPQDYSWELLEGVNVPLAPYVGPTTSTHHGGLLSHLKPHHHTTTGTTTTGGITGTTTGTNIAPTTVTPVVAGTTSSIPSTTATTTTAVPVAAATTVVTSTTTPAPIASTTTTSIAVPVAPTATVIPTTTMAGATNTVPSSTTAAGVGGVGATSLPAGALGSAHIRVRAEPKLIGELRLAVKEVIVAGATAPLLLNVKFAAPEQRFTTGLINGVGGRFVFPSSEFLIRVDPSNNVRDVFIEVIQNGIIIGETRVTLFDAWRPGGLLAAQPILVHSTKTRIGDMILSSVFEGKVQKR